MKKEAAATLPVFFFLLSILIATMIAVSVQAQMVKPSPETQCHDNGAFSISNLDKRGISVSIKKSGGSSSSPAGSWREMANGLYKFTSDDMAVVDVKGGYYTITVDKKSYGVTCPPFEFSCKLINLTINSCYKRNDTFFGKYTAYSYRYDKKNEFRFEKPFMLRYDATALVGGKKKELTRAPNIKSPDFEDINITRIKRVGSNTYTLKWQTPLNVSKLMIRYDDCDTARYKFYDSFVCTDRPSCSKDSECLQSERCDGSICTPISCAACQYQSNHTCVDYDCCTDLDCDSGFVCGSSRNCQPLSCEFNEYVAGHSCETLECAEDEYIFNSSCSKLNCAKGQNAVNHICKDITCNDDESLSFETNGCQKLKCGFLKKAKDHKCVSMFSLWFGRK
ncbi:hypothetical protein HYY73_05105 [Candidatus Woesearchaeota archaeon]|nr:hypothetical protein [Candidatus Woesearchaeota archaeon]